MYKALSDFLASVKCHYRLAVLLVNRDMAALAPCFLEGATLFFQPSKTSTAAHALACGRAAENAHLKQTEIVHILYAVDEVHNLVLCHQRPFNCLTVANCLD
jgi:hypothetical protein